MKDTARDPDAVGPLGPHSDVGVPNPHQVLHGVGELSWEVEEVSEAVGEPGFPVLSKAFDTSYHASASVRFFFLASLAMIWSIIRFSYVPQIHFKY